VRNRVGRTMNRATKSMKTVKSNAASTPMSRAAIRETRKTVTENRMKRKRGGPESTRFVRRKNCSIRRECLKMSSGVTYCDFGI